MPLDLAPGEAIRRTKLHELYGGRRQGGISPSRVSSNVFLITAPTGAQYGYVYDGPRTDGYFHYTGEGQSGDQQMTQGNRAVHEHESEGRELHLFEAAGPELKYLGEFRYVDHYTADAPAIDAEEPRTVIVFRLEQLVGVPLGPSRSKLDRLGKEPVKEVPIESQLTEQMLIEGTREPYEAERREHKLVRQLVDQLEAEGHAISRLQLRPDGEPAALFCDVYDTTTNTIYEAKGTVTRPAVRMAIGQLADYSRLVSPAPTRALLVPQEPRRDLLDLARSQGIVVVWPGPVGFVSSSDA
jgi:hypothetical protein